MNTAQYLRDAARGATKRALPILSFPASQKMGVTVKELATTAELQARAMATVAQCTDTLAAVSLMDLSVEAEAFGANVRFADNEVPAVTGRLVDGEDSANALQVPGTDKGRAPVCAQAIRLAKEYVKDRPVLAGMIGPFSLAGRLMDVTEIMYACFDEPETVKTVLKKATEYIIAYGSLLKDAGANGVVLAEPLAGLLGAEMFAEFSMPYVKRVIGVLQDDSFAVVYHNCGNTLAMLPEIFSQGAAAYHFGNAVDMEKVLANAPEDALCMGNIDPAGQFARGTQASIREKTLALLSACGERDNFILSSGCDIPADARWENIDAFFAALAEYNKGR